MADEPIFEVTRYGSIFVLDEGGWRRIPPGAESDAFLDARIAAEREDAPRHDCDAELRASWDFDPFRCEPRSFRCSCGRTFVHVCDEAEGCSWVDTRAGEAGE